MEEEQPDVTIDFAMEKPEVIRVIPSTEAVCNGIIMFYLLVLSSKHTECAVIQNDRRAAIGSQNRGNQRENKNKVQYLTERITSIEQ